MILQSDPAWATARIGHVTASRISDVLARTKTGPGASRINYAAELIAERLTLTAAPSFTNAAMQWGIDTEPHARAAYEFRTDENTGESGFVVHPKIEWSGASPDGFVGDYGLVEFKCPNTATHIDTLLSQNIPGKYEQQMTWQLACTGRKWCDFVSFDPRLPEEMRMFVKRFEPDQSDIASMERAVEIFLGDIEDTLTALRRQYAEAA